MNERAIMEVVKVLRDTLAPNVNSGWLARVDAMILSAQQQSPAPAALTAAERAVVEAAETWLAEPPTPEANGKLIDTIARMLAARAQEQTK